jgi:Putative auto-transporter adhesin, head GIN domain
MKLNFFGTIGTIINNTTNDLNVIQGSGISKKKYVELSKDITNIESDGSFAVTINYSTMPQAKITGDDNIVDNITMKTKGNTLSISLQDNISISPKTNLQVDIMLPLYTKKINLHGSGAITGGSICEQLEQIDLSGSGRILVEKLGCACTSIFVSGSGNVTIIHGKVDILNIMLSGSGIINTKGMVAVSCIAKVTSSGNVNISAEKRLEATINGSGTIKYSCNGDVSTKVNGSGKIIKE